MMMKHVFSFVLLGLGAAALGGCPIYGDDSDRANRVCVGNDCYSCPDPYISNDCYGFSCSADSDCPSGYACGTEHRCHLTDGTTNPTGDTPCSKPSDCPSGSSCGADDICHAGDCSTSGCPSTFVCKLESGVPTCEPVGGDGGGTSSCKSDSDCPTPAGSKCLSGTCYAPDAQCADATQCAPGSQCVQGACTPSCNADKPCPTGYSCDTAKGVCTGNAGACTTSAQCTSTQACVEQHCVDQCGAGATCPSGLICIDGGCTPDEQPVFTCTTEGTQDKCQAGSICLRHSCYISCDADAGSDACKNADTFNVCKSVSTSSGNYSVCGSTTNLGSDCDPTQGKLCPSPNVCIDGFCR
jgi:hypothetical protein